MASISDLFNDFMSLVGINFYNKKETITHDLLFPLLEEKNLLSSISLDDLTSDVYDVSLTNINTMEELLPILEVNINEYFEDILDYYITHTYTETATPYSDFKEDLTHDLSLILDDLFTHKYYVLKINIPTVSSGDSSISSVEVVGLVSENENLSSVAFTGSYTDLTSKPTIPSASSTTPSADVTGGAVGSSSTYAKADHQHPLSTAYVPSEQVTILYLKDTDISRYFAEEWGIDMTYFSTHRNKEGLVKNVTDELPNADAVSTFEGILKSYCDEVDLLPQNQSFCHITITWDDLLDSYEEDYGYLWNGSVLKEIVVKDMIGDAIAYINQ